MSILTVARYKKGLSMFNYYFDSAGGNVKTPKGIIPVRLLEYSDSVTAYNFLAVDRFFALHWREAPVAQTLLRGYIVSNWSDAQRLVDSEVLSNSFLNLLHRIGGFKALDSTLSNITESLQYQTAFTDTMHWLLTAYVYYTGMELKKQNVLR